MGSLDFYNEVLRPRALTEILAVNVHRDETTLTPVMLFRKRKQPLFDKSAPTPCSVSRLISTARCV